MSVCALSGVGRAQSFPNSETIFTASLLPARWCWQGTRCDKAGEEEEDADDPQNTIDGVDILENVEVRTAAHAQAAKNLAAQVQCAHQDVLAVAGRSLYWLCKQSYLLAADRGLLLLPTTRLASGARLPPFQSWPVATKAR